MFVINTPPGEGPKIPDERALVYNDGERSIHLGPLVSKIKVDMSAGEVVTAEVILFPIVKDVVLQDSDVLLSSNGEPIKKITIEFGSGSIVHVHCKEPK